ncbi:MAG: 16S rRNA processing protein RimM [Owenweeksia sp.]|nr:16S rRNA processing protein RimM [Owenweeksia sp.]
MRKEDCFQLGHISRKHGYSGELIAVFDTDYPEEYQNLESVFVAIHGELVPFFIDRLEQNSKGHFILQFEDLEPEECDNLIDRELWLPLELLPPFPEKTSISTEVIGFEVIDKQAGKIGTCAEVIDRSAQPLFRVLKDGIEILVPAVDEFIEEINRGKE